LAAEAAAYCSGDFGGEGVLQMINPSTSFQK